MPPAPRVEELLRSHIASGTFPGAVYLIADPDRILAEGALGMAVVDPERIPAGPETIYDLASLTKPLSCALLAVLQRAEGRLRLEDRLADHLPGWDAADERSAITLLDLLLHRSGLPAWDPLYIHAADRETRIARINRLRLARPPGSEVVYSDLGYILLGFALERAGGAPLDRQFAERVARPLGLAALQYRPAASLKRRIAATEKGNRREMDLAGEEASRYNEWRTGVIWGEVHDHNAHTLGGVAGHAGLFGTARAVHALAREFLMPRALIDGKDDLDLFRTDRTPGLSQARAVGFQLATTPGCSAGSALAGASFGHVGTTGTSLWIDPEARRIHVLLTNRVHPRFLEIDMNAVRRAFHEVAATI